MITAIATLALIFSPSVSLPGLFADDPPKAEAPPEGDPLAEARAATHREDWDDAVEKFRAFLDAKPKAPQAPEARFWAGFCLVKMGENEKAVEILQPFTEALAKDKWADDALLQLGNALHGQGLEPEALAAWQLHLEKYPESVWRTEVSLNLIDLLFYNVTDHAACFAVCERLTKEVDDREATTQARYLGACCLNAMNKFKESEAWADRLFDPESPLEEAWRRLLGAQHDLLLGRVESSLAAVESLAGDFPDLDQNDRQDLLLKTTYVLRSSGRSDRAAELLTAELVRSAGRPEDEVDALLDELETIFGDDRELEYLAALRRLADDSKVPIVVRVSALDHHAEALVESEREREAEAMLRNVLVSETAEFPRFRAGLKLAEILLDEPARRDEGIKVIEQVRSGLKRRDLIHQLQVASDRHRKREEADEK
jgi:tetratricopeptide (TPR) repeat protein